MSLPRFTVGHGDNVEGLRQDVRDFAAQLGVGAGATFIRGAAIATTETLIRHGLTDAPSGVFAIGQADARVWETRAPDSSYVYLAASAAVTCNLLVV